MKKLIGIAFLVVALSATWFAFGRDASTIWTSNYIFDAGDSGPQWATDFNNWATSLEAEWVTRSDNFTIQNATPTIKLDDTTASAADFDILANSDTLYFRSYASGGATATYEFSFISGSDVLYLYAGNKLMFEGSTSNDYETTLAVTDPTADNTVTLPNATGTVPLTARTVFADGDTTPSVATNTTLYSAINYSSATTLVDIDGAIDGQVIIILSDQNLDIANGDPFYLTGDWTPDSGEPGHDTLMLVASGCSADCNFLEVSRSDN